MKRYVIIILLAFIYSTGFAQDKWDKFNPFIGSWKGIGAVDGSGNSVISAEFNYIMNRQYIEIKNHSEFEPTEKNKEGEIHDDRGIISFNKSRKKYIFRQYHVEGFFNQYVLNDSLSTAGKLVFESELIENFVLGGTVRYTIILNSKDEIETIFDIGMPGKEMECYGNNKLQRVK